jgi:Protein of unknown function (DUF4239)
MPKTFWQRFRYCVNKKAKRKNGLKAVASAHVWLQSPNRFPDHATAEERAHFNLCWGDTRKVFCCLRRSFWYKIRPQLDGLSITSSVLALRCDNRKQLCRAFDHRLSAFQWLIVGRLRLTEEMNNDIIFFASAIAVFYSLTVGLIALGVWTTYSQVENTVSAEATTIGCFYRDVSGYPEPARTRLQAQVREYAVFLIEQAWPAQRRGQSTDVATRRLSALEQELVRFKPATLGQQVLHAKHSVNTKKSRVCGVSDCMYWRWFALCHVVGRADWGVPDDHRDVST